MKKTMSILGKVLIWIIVPILVVLIGSVLCSLLLPSNTTGVIKFAYGVIASAALAVPVFLCKIWEGVCKKAWGQPAGEDEVKKQAAAVESIWKCNNCGAENSINYGQCKKCGLFRAR